MKKIQKIFSSDILSVIIACILFAALVFLFVGGLVRCSVYNRYIENPIYVDAVVTNHKEYWDSDEGGNVYEIYVTYTLDGATYPDVYYKQVNEKAEMIALGEHLSLIADPIDHGKLYQNSVNTFMILSVDVILCIMIAAWQRDFRRKRLTVSQCRSMEAGDLEKDLHIIIRARMGRVLWLLLTVLFGCLPLAFPNLFGNGHWIAAAVTGVFWVISMINAIVATYKVRHGMYTVHTDKLVKKEAGTDSDGDPVYRLCYTNGTHRWDTTVSKAEYQRANVGAAVAAVYLQGCSRPIMHYNHLGNATE